MSFILIMPAVRAQDTTYVKKKLSETDIAILFSYYSQDGNHSAVTGGVGTEKLQVYSPHASLSQVIDSTHIILVNAGVDVISSASTDVDNHFELSAGYGYRFKKIRTEAGLGGSFALESDFLSKGFNLWLNHVDKADMNSLSLAFQAYFDDLRWGRLNPDYKKPVTLVYPVELRDTNWFDIYMRYSYNLELAYERVINRKMVIGFYPGLIIQEGLLSTPFHRVYFQGREMAKVENLPGRRLKVPLGVKLNSYLGTNIILNAYYRFYWDDFDIL